MGSTLTNIGEVQKITLLALHIIGKYLFTKIAFVFQMCQPEEQKTLSTASEALVGILMTICDFKDIFPIILRKFLQIK